MMVGGSGHATLNDKFAIYDNGAGKNRFVINSSGNIAIGTDNTSTDRFKVASGSIAFMANVTNGSGSIFDESSMQELLDWRHQRGYVVYTVTTNQIDGGNYEDNIYSYIKNAYEKIGVSKGMTVSLKTDLRFLGPYDSNSQNDLLAAHFNVLADLVDLSEGTIVVSSASFSSISLHNISFWIMRYFFILIIYTLV